MKKEMRNKITMHDFDFARLMGMSGEDDITEWFCDHDIYLIDLIPEKRNEPTIS